MTARRVVPIIAAVDRAATQVFYERAGLREGDGSGLGRDLRLACEPDRRVNLVDPERAPTAQPDFTVEVADDDATMPAPSSPGVRDPNHKIVDVMSHRAGI